MPNNLESICKIQFETGDVEMCILEHCNCLLGHMTNFKRHIIASLPTRVEPVDTTTDGGNRQCAAKAVAEFVISVQ